MSKARFERRKPHVNIGTIGHIDHGNIARLLSICNLSFKILLVILFLRSLDRRISLNFDNFSR